MAGRLFAALGRSLDRQLALLLFFLLFELLLFLLLRLVFILLTAFISHGVPPSIDNVLAGQVRAGSQVPPCKRQLYSLMRCMGTILRDRGNIQPLPPPRIALVSFLYDISPKFTPPSCPASDPLPPPPQAPPRFVPFVFIRAFVIQNHPAPTPRLATPLPAPPSSTVPKPPAPICAHQC